MGSLRSLEAMDAAPDLTRTPGGIADVLIRTHRDLLRRIEPFAPNGRLVGRMCEVIESAQSAQRSDQRWSNAVPVWLTMIAASSRKTAVHNVMATRPLRCLRRAHCPRTVT